MMPIVAVVEDSDVLSLAYRATLPLIIPHVAFEAVPLEQIFEEETWLRYAAAIVDADLGETFSDRRAGVRLVEWLAEYAPRIATIIVSAHEIQAEEAPAACAIYQKPTPMFDLARTIEECLK